MIPDREPPASGRQRSADADSPAFERDRVKRHLIPAQYGLDGPRGERVINLIRRVSKVGRRIYMGQAALPRPTQGLGIAIVSTSRGVMSDRRFRVENVGGEVVAEVN